MGRNHLVRLDFNGWQYFEFSIPSGIEAYDYDWPVHPSGEPGIRDMNYGKISSVTVFVNDAPPHAEISCYIGTVKALRERASVIANPQVTLHGKTALFPVTLKTNQYLEYWGEEEAVVYNENGYTIETITKPGVVPEVRSGINTAAFSCDGIQEQRKQVRVEIITMGKTIAND